MRFAVLGLGAAGCACAARLLDLAGPLDEIWAVERSAFPPPSPALWPEYAAGAVDGATLSESAPWVRWVADAAERNPSRLAAVWGRGAKTVDAVARRVRLDGGEEVVYDRLLVATGAAPVMPRLPGLSAPAGPASGVHCLGTAARVESLRRELALRPAGSSVAVVGAGPSGVRLAELLHGRGCQVTLLEAKPFLLPGLSSPAVSEALSAAARKAGIRTETGTEVRGATLGAGRKLKGLVYSRGGRDAFQPCELAVFCTGFSPRGLPGVRPGPAQTGGRGLPVNPDMSVRGLEDVFAAGDCALPMQGWTGPPGLWPVASWQGRQAALAMAGLEPAPLPSRVVLTVRFLGLLVAASRPYAPQDHLHRERGGPPWDVEVVDASAARSPGPPPEVLGVAG